MPAREEYRPAPQFLHSLRSLEYVYVPGMQREHCSTEVPAGLLRYCPDGQDLHLVVVPSPYFPYVQSLHVGDRYWPGLHFTVNAYVCA